MATEIDLIKDSTMVNLLGAMTDAMKAQTEAIKHQAVVNTNVDTTLDTTSDNPIANSAVTAGLADKQDTMTEITNLQIDAICV